MKRSGYVIVEGNIGVGKSTFAQMLASEIAARGCKSEFLPEPDEKTNPFLDKYYEDPARCAPPAICKQRIEKRARPCETGKNPIPVEYLVALDEELGKLERVLDARCRVMHIPWNLDLTHEQIESQARAVADALLSHDGGDWDF